jgi:hypothetical protein
MIAASATPAWTDLFPQSQLETVLKYVVGSWQDLVGKYPPAHRYEVREEKLTDSLADHCDDPSRRQTCGITGRFVAEKWKYRRLPTGQVLRVARSDIVYTAAIPGGPQLVMEFKKLADSARLHALYCSEGISRFVRGIYTPEQKIGAMCGIVKPHCSEPAPLVAYLTGLTLAQKKDLGCDAAGYGTTRPSVLAPGVSAFDSRHARGAACGNLDIALTHVFLVAAPS